MVKWAQLYGDRLQLTVPVDRYIFVRDRSGGLIIVRIDAGLIVVVVVDLHWSQRCPWRTNSTCTISRSRRPFVELERLDGTVYHWVHRQVQELD